MSPRTALALGAMVLLAGCGSGNSPTPSPPGPGAGETITGRERIGWDQAAGNPADLAALRYAIYVDGTRSEMADVSCATTAGSAGFACSGRLPAMSAGSHVLEIASFVDAGGIIESARSAPLRVNVTGSTSPAEPVPLAPGDVVVTADGVQLDAEVVATDLPEATDLAVAPDGRLFVTAADGRLRLVDDGTSHEVLHLEGTEDRGGLLGLALAPDFSNSGHLYVLAAVTGEAGAAFRVFRYRLDAGRLVDRMVILPDLPASQQPAASLRFGPDASLYLAVDHGGRDDAAARASEWNGKILRFDPDGRTPSDQPAASPVVWSGVRVPRGLAWTPDGMLWAAEEGLDGVERLRAIELSAEAPRRATGRTSYAMPRPFGGRAVAAYRGDAVPEFSGDLFLAGAEAGYLLRISFDRGDRVRAVRSERLLEGRFNTIRAVTVAHDGSLYFAAGTTVWRLTASQPPRGRAPR